ncbi:MAG TPA: DUF2207 domain-containing protein [Vicinamibacterales bacterium]|nr:DUF2207 domain-containing protein [Vicinamibacterales bacterium]
MKPRVFLLLLWLAGLSAVPAEAKSYSAERFDSHIRILAGGTVEVTETVVFRFVDGPFTFVFREIPRRGTDSIEVVRATMDGRALPTGNQPGQVELGGNSRLRVQWHFAEPVSNSTHTFTLAYRVEGVVRQSEDGDLLAWRALPQQHEYAIDSSTIEIELPAPLARPPAVESRRAAVPWTQFSASAADDRAQDQTVRLRASGIGKNGWVEARLSFAPGSVIASPPLWQAARERADALAPSWLWAAALVAVAGFVLLWSLRLRDDQPRRDTTFAGTSTAPPDSNPPAIAGALAADGRVSLANAMATLLSIADRGAIVIKEEPRTLGQRTYSLDRRGARLSLAGHEQVALDLAFGGAQEQERQVSLSKARRRLQARLGRFRDAVHTEMTAMGLVDARRKAVHTRFGAVSLGLLLLGAAGLFVVAVALVPQYRGWPLMVPAAVIVVALAGFIFQGATTQLSDTGQRAGERWRAYQRHLKEVAREQAHLGAESPSGVLPFAVALGLAAAWAKFAKTRPSLVPPWFQAEAASDAGGSFHAFVAYGGSPGGGHGGGGGGGGAAGGGGSGAG